MNATAITPKSANSRLNRIQTVSRMVRYVILSLFAFTIGFYYFLFYQSVMESPWAWSWLNHPGYAFKLILMGGILCFWYWKLAQLFRFYERGLIFATETIRCIKTLGLLCVLNAFVTSVWLNSYHLLSSPPPPGVVVKSVKIIPSMFGMGFFSFSIAGINVGLLLAGVIMVIIAWIMDEGRKIQEEQELTV